MPNPQQYNQYNYPNNVNVEAPNKQGLPAPGQIYPGSDDYEYRNLIEQYGSIIKELTDTDKIINEFELRIRGKKLDGNKIVEDPLREPRIKTDRAASDFVDIIRGIVNRHTDFSFYEEAEAYSIIQGANIELNRWLMLQGDDVPTRYRSKIVYEALCLISASLHKAMKGRILNWTKGSFNEGRNLTETGEKKSFLDYIPFMPKGRR